MRKYCSHKEIIQTTVEILLGRRPSSLRIAIPPGCATLGLMDKIVSNFRLRKCDTTKIAYVTSDTVRNDKEFVTILAEQWTKECIELMECWRDLGRNQDLSDLHRIDAFCNIANDLGYKLVAFLDRFDKVFLDLSSQLLATFRSLDDNEKVLFVIGAHSTYQQLYEQREGQEPEFTSAFGTTHAELVLGPLSRQDAATLWESWEGLKLEDSRNIREAAKFIVAYENSGGLYDAFKAAYQCLKAIISDEIEYDAVLEERLPETFRRLLLHADAEQRVIPSIVALHRGLASAQQVAHLTGHRWGHFLVLSEDEKNIRLRCSPLGQMAVLLMQGTLKTPVNCEPLKAGIDSFRKRDFCSCIDRLRTFNGNDGVALLTASAEMMQEVFGTAPMSLYFRPDISWEKVEKMAEMCEQLCTDENERHEFTGWRKVAEANIGMNVSRATHRDLDLSKAALFIAIRILAVERDPNAGTAAYMGHPLVEELLRRYARYVLEIEPKPESFNSFSDAEISRWWGTQRKFKRPESSEKLGGGILALLAALGSEKAKRPLFLNREEYHEVGSILSNVRNELGHNIFTPDISLKTQLLEMSKKLFYRLCEHARLDLTLQKASSYVQLPTAFLNRLEA